MLPKLAASPETIYFKLIRKPLLWSGFLINLMITTYCLMNFLTIRFLLSMITSI